MKTFQKNYILEHPLKTVYSHWVSEKTVIPPAAQMQVEPKVGGIYKLIMPGGMEMNGRFSKVEPMKTVCYSWQWDGDSESTQVEVVFSACPQGTDISITHSGFLSEASFNMHSTGWDSYIKGFSEHIQKSA